MSYSKGTNSPQYSPSAVHEPRKYSRHAYAKISSITLVALWLFCATLWVLRYVLRINAAPLPNGAEYIGPILGAGIALIYGNWMRTVMARIGVSEMEHNLGRARLWLDAMSGNTAFATNFMSFQSISILLIVSSASIFSAGVNFALTVQDDVVTVERFFYPFGSFPDGVCADTNSQRCPVREALETIYNVNIYSPKALHSVDGRLTYTAAAAGASAGDILAAVDAAPTIRGTLCATVPTEDTALYSCTAVPALAVETGLQVESSCPGTIAIASPEQPGMGTIKCATATGALPT